MGAEKAILSLAPTMQSLALLGAIRKRRKKKLLGSGIDVLTGVPLISETSNAVAGL